MQGQVIETINLRFDAQRLRSAQALSQLPLRVAAVARDPVSSPNTENWPTSRLTHYLLKNAARFASVLAAVPKTQPPRPKVVHDHTRRVSALVQQLQESPSEAMALTKEILRVCEGFLAAPQGMKPEDSEIVDTQSLREEVEGMVKAKSPLVRNIPLFPGTRIVRPEEFFETHYGRYNQPGFETIFKVDLRAIDSKLFFALRFACGGAENMPLLSIWERTNAINEGRFGSEERRLQSRRSIISRETRILRQ